MCERGGEEEERVKEKTEVGGTLREKRDKNKKRGEAGGASEGSEELKLPSRASHVGYMITPERVLRGELSVVFRMLISHHDDHHRQGSTKPPAI